MSETQMTLQKIRDWHARQSGWAMVRGCWERFAAHLNKHEHSVEHPYPATLDGAASAMPFNWQVLKHRYPMENRPSWIAEGNPDRIVILSSDDEIYDRYLLAMKVREYLSHNSPFNNNTFKPQIKETDMTNEYRYEKRPVRVRAIQAEFEMHIKHPHGLNGYLTVEAGQWIVEPEGDIVEIVSDEDFRKNYRTIRPDVAIRTMSQSAVGSDGRNEW